MAVKNMYEKIHIEELYDNGETLYLSRLRRGLTRKDISENCNISIQMLYKIENGKTNILSIENSREHVECIVNYLSSKPIIRNAWIECKVFVEPLEDEEEENN
jgi:transcriptional regulator with XRE-family HTH domain